MLIKRSLRSEQHSAPTGQPTLPSFPGGALPAPEQRLQTLLVRSVAVLALAVSLVYLVWRTVDTVDLAVWWVSVPLLLCEAHAALGLALFTFSPGQSSQQARLAQALFNSKGAVELDVAPTTAVQYAPELAFS
jgi:hypothetical protein